MLNITTDAILNQLDQSSILNIGIVASPEPIGTTSNGVARGRALYDTPPPGSQSGELARSSRSRVRTERAKAGFDPEIAASKRRSARAKRTRARNQSKSQQRGPQSDAESTAVESMAAESEVEGGGRAPSRSPTPIFTAEEPEGQLDRDELQERLSRKFQQIVANSGTQTLLDVDTAISVDPAYATQSQEHNTETRFLPPIPVGVGGGFHLDHPTHRPGNNKTYRGSKGRHNQQARSRSEIEVSSDNEPVEMDIDPPHIPFPVAQQLAPQLPPQPIHDPNSPFNSGAEIPFLGYPDDESPERSHRQPSNPNLVLRAPAELNSPPPYGIPTSSQSLGDPIRTPAHNRGHSTRAAPTNTLQLHAERSVTYTSEAHPTPGQSNARQEPPPQGLQRSDHTSSQQQHSQSCARLPSPLPRQIRPLGPLAPSTAVAPTRKRAATSTQAAGGKVYRTRLNIIEINSQRPPMAPRSRQPSRSRQPLRSRQPMRGPAVPSSTRQRDNTTPAPCTQLSSHHQSNREEHDPLPDIPSDDEPDLLETFDEDEHAAELAAQGITVKSGSVKPTVNDLHGIERALWKSTRNVTWGFGSMGQGNVQTRDVYGGWIESAFYVVVKEKYPHLAARPMSANMKTLILNSLPNCRYQDLLRLRESTKDYFKLKHPGTEQERQENEQVVYGVHPDLFHYRDAENEIDPYEGGIMPRALTDTFFYSSKAIGATYPGLFEKTDDPKDSRKHLAILAYLATMVQVTLEEWKDGYFKKGKLNANRLLSIFICHYDSLKVVSSRAPDRLSRLYKEWFNNALAFSQAQANFKRKGYIQAVIRPENVRPDTPRHSPTPHSISVSQLQLQPQLASPTPGPSGAPACVSPTDRVSRRYSPLALRPAPAVESPSLRSRVRRLTPCPSPSRGLPGLDAPDTVSLSAPQLVRLPVHLLRPFNPSPTPERDAEGRFTSKAKAKGRAAD